MASFQERSGKTLITFCLAAVTLAVIGAANPPEQKFIAVPGDLRTTPRQLAVNLNWEPTQGSVGYEVQRGATTNGPFKTLNNNLSWLTVFSDFVGEETTNFYRVRSIGTNDERRPLPSDWSQIIEGHSEALDQGKLLTEMQLANFNY